MAAAAEIRATVRLPQPWLSNCLLWARAQWCRHGGQILKEPSRHGWWSHYAWSPDGEQWFCYVPRWDKASWLRRWHQRLLRFPPPLFRGVVKEGKR